MTTAGEGQSNGQSQALDVNQWMGQVRADLQKLTTKQQKTLDREIGYFEGHKE